MTISSHFATVSALADAAASAIGQRRPIVVHPDGALAVHVMEASSLPAGHMDAWFDPDADGQPEGCFHLQLLGHTA